MPAGRPMKWSSPEELERLSNEYFSKRLAEDKPLLITGLCYFLDSNRETFNSYESKAEFSDTVKRIKGRIAAYAEEQVYIGKNVAGAIFMMKNFGFSDKQEIEHTGNAYKPIVTEIVRKIVK